MRQQFRSLGALLMDRGLLTRERLDAALEEQKRSGEKLGRILVARGWVRERDIHLVLDGMMIVVFRLGAEDFGVETLLVREIVRHEPSRPLPGAPEWFDGVRDYRGRVIPVVDLGRRLGRAPSLDGGASRTVIYEGPGARLWGLKVDSVSAVVQVSSDHLEEAPQAAGADAAWSAGRARLEGGDVVLLNVEALLAQGEREGAPGAEAGGHEEER